MAHPNEELVRTVYAAFLAGDLESVRPLFDPDIVWHVPGRSPISGDVKGVDAVMQALGYVASLLGNTLELEVHDVLASDDHAVGLISERAEQDGRRFQDSFAQVIHFKDGRVTEVWNVYTDLYARDEFWSEGAA